MKTKISFSNHHPTKESLFQVQGITWVGKDNYFPLKFREENNLAGISIVLEEMEENWGKSMEFIVHNSTNIPKKIKLFFLIEWLKCNKDTVGVYSISEELLFCYSRDGLMAVSNSLSTCNEMKKSIYPLNLKGLKLWKNTLQSGILTYQPLIAGKNMMVHDFELELNPFDMQKGNVYCIEATDEEKVLKLNTAIKNRLALSMKK